VVYKFAFWAWMASEVVDVTPQQAGMAGASNYSAGIYDYLTLTFRNITSNSANYKPQNILQNIPSLVCSWLYGSSWFGVLLFVILAFILGYISLKIMFSFKTQESTKRIMVDIDFGETNN
jgi:hypothetical protein